MSDEMPRLLDGQLSPLERTLLESAKGDVPSPEAMQLAARSLGIADALPGAKWGLLAKGSAIAVVSVLGLLGVARMRRESAEPTPKAPVVAQLPLEKPPEGNPPEKIEVAETAPPKVVTPEKAPPAKAGKGSIEGEIRMVEDARRALDGGDNGSALSIVSEYRRRYPHPALAEEASVIRILALDRSGNGARASREAAQFLASHPKTPHASRLAPIANRTSP